ncbi:hypothetical protein [Mycolicibacterium setense]
MWQSTPPPSPRPRRWQLTPPVVAPVAKPWKVKYTREFGLTLTPQIGMGATPSPIFTADFGLTLSPQIGMVAAGRSTAEFGLTLTPQIGVDAVVRIPGSFGLTLTPTLGFDAALAPVEFDNSTAGGTGGTTTRSFTHVLNGNCIVILFTNSTSSAATCTYGGVNIPRVFGPSNSGTVFPANGYCSVFALVSNSLPQGSNTVSCTNAGTASAAGAVSFRHVGALGTIVSNTANGNINMTINPGAGGAAVAGFGGGGISFGAITPNEAVRYGFSAFVTWPTVMGWGLDTGGGITFAATQASSKAGAVVPILPAT